MLGKVAALIVERSTLEYFTGVQWHRAINSRDSLIAPATGSAWTAMSPPTSYTATRLGSRPGCVFRTNRESTYPANLEFARPQAVHTTRKIIG